jgi:protein-S-isoprenylcysteine O-methyltransferase Ste14
VIYDLSFVGRKSVVELSKQFERDGNWLFRWRSYLPLLMIALFILAFLELKYSGHSNILDQSWVALCFAVAFIGLGVRILTVGYVPRGTSGRNTVRQKAETLNTTGMYSIVRHPLYLANSLMWLGVSMFARLWWFSLIVTLIFWLYYERIMFAEEMFLKSRFGDTFSRWAETTPCFIPNIKGWKSPNLTFSLKTVFKREFSTFFSIIAIFTFLKIIQDLFIGGKLVFDFVWIIVFAASLAFYLTFLILKKKTKLLDVEGR